jgi:hypothetical protein
MVIGNSEPLNGWKGIGTDAFIVFLSSNLFDLCPFVVSDDRDYRHYLGAEFLKAIEEVECFRSSSSALAPQLLTAAILASHVLLPLRNIF